VATRDHVGWSSRYVIALLAAVVAVATWLALAPLTPAAFALAAYPAVAVAAAMAGAGPGLVSALLCAAAGVAFARAPWPAGLVEPGLFLAGAAVLAVVAHLLGRSRREAEAARTRMEREVTEHIRVQDMLAANARDLERRVFERDALLGREQTARAEAQRRQREAEAMGRAKDEFLAVLGHELRNPLGAISNAIRALDETGNRAVKLQSIITRQSRHLGRLLDDLLDVSRVAVGKVTLHPEPVDLYEIAERAVAALEQEHRTARHQVVLTGESTMVEADPIRLEQIARNLLDNALKYTPPGGRIDVVAATDGSDAILRVTDTGEGIPPEILPRIFEPFVQAGAPARGGLGLGLSVVKHLAELHAGSVFASSGGPGLGSEFIVRLPRLASMPAVSAAQEHTTPKPPPRRVLIVEDHPDVRDGLRMLLETWGHQVTETSDGRAGLEQARTGDFDIALVDVGLPGMDGYAVAQALREEPPVQAIRLVAVTGYGQPADRERARAAGFDAILVKPIDPDRLARILAQQPDDG
jgi:two-component system, sensor histidine kinase